MHGQPSALDIQMTLQGRLPGCEVSVAFEGDDRFALHILNGATGEAFSVPGLPLAEYGSRRRLAKLGKQIFEDMVLLKAGVPIGRIHRQGTAIASTSDPRVPPGSAPARQG
ncbi:hypothetical protein TUM18999_35350 [Pseudomonas tohonis]|uniref:DUF3509 domain-containing protein n=2 Tax=Pseudomonas tohonis TaxID=2725477 RepID=A0A6J4E8Q5_9PSED|nr:hypothetical protein [Pseudomonas tohonis]BCG25344.1 hypothetical protein TUM18999_35350 [Pseudomonas tohonis]GJN54826.1 hypothetical protein TUM20286_45780 [Pseudomonas tohonis]